MSGPVSEPIEDAEGYEPGSEIYIDPAGDRYALIDDQWGQGQFLKLSGEGAGLPVEIEDTEFFGTQYGNLEPVVGSSVILDPEVRANLQATTQAQARRDQLQQAALAMGTPPPPDLEPETPSWVRDTGTPYAPEGATPEEIAAPSPIGLGREPEEVEAVQAAAEEAEAEVEASKAHQETQAAKEAEAQAKGEAEQAKGEAEQAKGEAEQAAKAGAAPTAPAAIPAAAPAAPAAAAAPPSAARGFGSFLGGLFGGGDRGGYGPDRGGRGGMPPTPSQPMAPSRPSRPMRPSRPSGPMRRRGPGPRRRRR